MSEGGDIDVLPNILPKDVAKEVGNVKLFNKWDYDVEVRDISLTYVFHYLNEGSDKRRETKSDAIESPSWRYPGKIQQLF